MDPPLTAFEVARTLALLVSFGLLVGSSTPTPPTIDVESLKATPRSRRHIHWELFALLFTASFCQEFYVRWQQAEIDHQYYETHVDPACEPEKFSVLDRIGYSLFWSQEAHCRRYYEKLHRSTVPMIVDVLMSLLARPVQKTAELCGDVIRSITSNQDLIVQCAIFVLVLYAVKHIVTTVLSDSRKVKWERSLTALDKEV